MEQKIIENENYRLHLINTDKFKTIKFRVIMKGELKKEEITLRNFLMDMLTYSTKNYKTRKSLIEKSQDLYATNVYTRGYRLANFQVMNVYLSLLNEKYTEEGMLEESVKLLSEIIFNPNVENGKFDSESFKLVYKNNKEMIEDIKNNTSKYSLVRMLETMGVGPYSYREFGYLDDLNKITETSLFEYYENFIKKSDVDIYVIGNIKDYNIEELLNKYMKFNKNNRRIELERTSYNDFRSSPKELKEKEDINQSRLVMGYKLDSLDEFERNYALTIYNLLLGATGDSKLFKNVREKYSICYQISSSLDKLDNLLYIKAGINKKNYEKCVDAIKKEINDMKIGEFTDEELEKAKITYIALLDDLMDDDEAIIDTFIASDLLGIGNVDERKKLIMEVSREDIMNLTDKIKLDTIYLLEGGTDED